MVVGDQEVGALGCGANHCDNGRGHVEEVKGLG